MEDTRTEEFATCHRKDNFFLQKKVKVKYNIL